MSRVFAALSSWYLPILLVVVGLVAVLIVWKLPQWQVSRVKGLSSRERFDRVNEARKTVATILGGIVLLAGFFGTWQNLRVAQESASTSQKALLVSEEGQITDRFTKAIEQLGAVYPDGKPKLDVRLGGIYALERIANDSEKDHWPIMEVLCTYVREHAVRQANQHKKSSGTDEKWPEPRVDIQAILTVLGRRDRKYEKEGQLLYLANVDLSGAVLTGANFSGADLFSTDLSRAVLRGADFRNANLSMTKNLTQEQINVAIGNGDTGLPDNLHVPENWKK
jgi:hypothetical protein